MARRHNTDIAIELLLAIVRSKVVDSTLMTVSTVNCSARLPLSQYVAERSYQMPPLELHLLGCSLHCQTGLAGGGLMF